MHYFDYAATTPVTEETARRMSSVLTESFGNPSSMHPFGQAAARAMETDRADIAALLGCAPQDLFFTSCGTESDNWALHAALHIGRRRGKHIVTTAVEHSAVLEPCLRLRERGYEVTQLRPDRAGHIGAEQVLQAVRDDTVLVSVMSVNNETGNVYPVAQIGRLLKERGSTALFHTDHVQGFLKTPLTAQGADLISLSAHKIGGPKGIGALYIAPHIQTKIEPLLYGGGQERTLRSGTEATAQIAGFAAAARQRAADLSHILEHTNAMRDYAAERILEIPAMRIVGTPEAPHILCLSLPGYPAQNIVADLGAQGIFLSAGSACHKGKTSHVTAALGLTKKEAVGAFRVSFAESTTRASVDVLCDALREHQRRRFPML